jgi:hypothetical protein
MPMVKVCHHLQHQQNLRITSMTEQYPMVSFSSIHGIVGYVPF